MKTLLFVNGCVRGDNSRTLRLAKEYIELKKLSGFEVLERNLCATDLGFLTDRSFDEKGVQAPINDGLAEEFAAADEILLAAPFWEFLFPAVVACYFEAVSVAGKTFQYTEKGSVGLCKAGKLVYAYTAGDNVAQDDKLSEQYLQKLAALYGIKEFAAIYVGGLDIFGCDVEKSIASACEKIKNNEF